MNFRRSSLFGLLLIAAASFSPQAHAAVTDPLTGLPCKPELAKRHVLGVMVENTRPARPQSGLDKAGVVVEAYVEGGVTRYMGLFVSTDADVIGPVRSTRQFYASFVHQLHAWLGHCWAKKTGYATIKKLKVQNIDGVRIGKGRTPYFRVSTRVQPHNLYTSTTDLRRLAHTRGWKDTTLAPMFTFKDDAPVTKRPKEQYVGLDYSGRTYLAEFRYDPTSNSYKRFLSTKPHRIGSSKTKAKKDVLNGAPHTRGSSKQLSPKNLVVLIMKQRVVDKGGVLEITTVGKGKALYFIDGQKSEGQWVRKSENSRYQLLDTNGKPVLLNRGQTWISVIDNPSKVHTELIAKYHTRKAGKKHARTSTHKTKTLTSQR
ncbi:MAG: DUF3048 domain-containing protein [Myxococcales bacterium]|nr:DUF3048 domain-containing protein [Myxococcales bacterium]